jgi:hypothetical protein
MCPNQFAAPEINPARHGAQFLNSPGKICTLIITCWNIRHKRGSPAEQRKKFNNRQGLPWRLRQMPVFLL